MAAPFDHDQLEQLNDMISNVNETMQMLNDTLEKRAERMQKQRETLEEQAEMIKQLQAHNANGISELQTVEQELDELKKKVAKLEADSKDVGAFVASNSLEQEMENATKEEFEKTLENRLEMYKGMIRSKAARNEGPGKAAIDRMVAATLTATAKAMEEERKAGLMEDVEDENVDDVSKEELDEELKDNMIGLIALEVLKDEMQARRADAKEAQVDSSE